MIYVENMLKLEGGPIRELVGNMMLVALMDRLVDLDVSNFMFSYESWLKSNGLCLYFAFEILVGRDCMGGNHTR